MYEWTELKRRWEREQLTPEQAIGQLLLWGEEQQNSLTSYRRRQDLLEQQVNTLAAQVATLQAQGERRSGR